MKLINTLNSDQFSNIHNFKYAIINFLYCNISVSHKKYMAIGEVRIFHGTRHNPLLFTQLAKFQLILGLDGIFMCFVAPYFGRQRGSWWTDGSSRVEYFIIFRCIICFDGGRYICLLTNLNIYFYMTETD